MRRKGFLILGFIFGSFLVFIYLLQAGSPVFVDQPVFGEYNERFTFYDENGDDINSCDLNDNIILYNFISTSCPYDCPLDFKWFKLFIYDQLVDNEGFEDVKIVSVFIDTISDLKSKMVQFRDFHNLKSDKWIFATTSHHPFFDLDFKQGNPWGKTDTTYGYDKEAHLMTLMVDKNQKIRGKYLTYMTPEIRRITKEISLLIKEESSKESISFLPILGKKEFIPAIDKDTLFHTIPYWEFTNQSGELINSKSLGGKIHIVDFFFSYCPTICPVKTVNIRKIQEILNSKCISNVEFLSFSVDPERDSSERLANYVKDYDIDISNWNLFTGDQSEIYKLGIEGYLVPSQKDSLAPGGFLHSEKIMLIDDKARIRAFYNGTDSDAIQQIVSDVKTLQEE
jgi:protein SCO1